MNNFFYFLALVFLVGCGDSPSSPTDTTLKTIEPSCFEAYSSNPIIKSADYFSGSHWNDPSVMYKDDQYIMYASSSDNGFDSNISIYRLTSDDGITWNLNPTAPVLQKGSSGAWDDKAVETPSVVYYNNQYHMFYTGYQTFVSTDFKIGHATSNDGITWTKNSSSPILTPTGTVTDFNGAVVAEPGAVVYNNKIYLYFTGQGYNTDVSDQLQSIGLTTYDGNSWSSAQSVLVPDQSIYPRGDDISGYMGYSTPSAIEYDGKIHLFVDVAQYVSGNWTQVKLHHASSDDGINNFSQDNVAIHSYTDFSWTESEIRSIYPVYANDTFRIYYAGHNSSNVLAIGYSTCK